MTEPLFGALIATLNNPKMKMKMDKKPQMAKRKDWTQREEQALFDAAYARWQNLHLAEADKIPEPHCDVRCMATGWRKTKLRCSSCSGYRGD